MPTSVLLAQFLLHQTAVSLGRFVTNVDEPQQDFHDPIAAPHSHRAEKLQSQYDGILSSERQRTFASELTRFLSWSSSKRTESSIRITSDQVKTYFLNNVGDWFITAVQSEQTRKWIERMVDQGKDMYIVTGYHTLVDACITETSRGHRDSGGKFVLPLSAALTASSIVAPIGDPGISTSADHREGEERTFVAQGEQICAVQYRKIRHAWFSGKDVERIKLAKDTWWKRYDRPRFLHSDGLDMMEVSLEDAAAFDTRDTCTTEEGEVFAAALDDDDDDDDNDDDDNDDDDDDDDG